MTAADWYNKASEYDTAGKESEACECYKKAYELGYKNLPESQQPDFFLGFGSTLRNVNEPERSIQILQEGVSLFPEHSALKAFLALSLYSQGKFRSAARELFQCLAFGRGHPSLKSFERALSWYVQNLETHPHPPLGLKYREPRALAIALIKRSDGKMLLSTGYDTIKKEHYYRPLGGGIEHGETGAQALARELQEEIGKSVQVQELVQTVENIFTLEGQKAHEIILVYTAKFKNPSDELFEELDIVESGEFVSKAVWRSLEDIKREGAKLYPEELVTNGLIE